MTDSVTDLPSEIAKELRITLVPLSVRFGAITYRDGVDLTSGQFYDKLKNTKVLPVTSTPVPQNFADVYDKLAEEANEILISTI
ncbi:MAG: DegV family protein [Dehalococcoidales bacterium]|nr:DegV family protein [Dehalococcoidales bacterium]